MMAYIWVGGEVVRERVPVAFATHPAPWKCLEEVGVGHMMAIKEMSR